MESKWRHGVAKEYNILQDEFESIFTEAIQFISGIEFTLTKGLPQEKLAALRQCIEKIYINRPCKEIKVQIREVPVGHLLAVRDYII